jgi:hypothetical protein
MTQNPCRVIVPPYWTSVTAVNFSFTPFGDGGSGIRLYEWSLGSSAGAANVVAFQAYNGTAVVRPWPVPALQACIGSQ